MAIATYAIRSTGGESLYRIRRSNRTLVYLTLVLIALAIPVWGVAASLDLPLDTQIPLLLKIITYDRSVSHRASTEAWIIAIAYSSKSPDSVQVKDDFLSTASLLELTELEGKPLVWSLIDLDRPGEPFKSLEQDDYVALYVTPGNERRLEEIVAAARKAQVATLSGVAAYAEQGLSVAVSAENGKPQIVVNLPSSRAEGCDFSSDLLKLARVIR